MKAVLKHHTAYVALLLLVLLSACSKESSLVHVGGSTMGTTWSVKAVPVKGLSAQALNHSLQQELDAIEAKMSNWRDDSEVSSFNAAKMGCYDVSPATAKVVAAAQTIAAATAGAFDITTGPLIRLWGFGKRYTGDQVPSEDEISAVSASVGYQQLSLDGLRLCKKSDAVTINVSAIAKGYAVDQLVQVLAAQGYQHYLVEVGGELYAQGQNPIGRAWTIGVEQPISDGRAIMESVAVPVENMGVATSGDYRNYFEQNGRRYSHIISPVTGRPVQHQLASVTVLAQSSMQADAWATALLVMGLERGLALADQKGLAVLMVAHGQNSGDLELYESEAWLLQAR